MLLANILDKLSAMTTGYCTTLLYNVIVQNNKFNLWNTKPIWTKNGILKFIDIFELTYHDGWNRIKLFKFSQFK